MESMTRRPLGGSGLDVSEIGFGAWALGGSFGPQSDDDSRAALRRYLERGGRFVDTAQAYGDGRSERVIGEVVRETGADVVIATKLAPRKGRWSPPSWTPLEEVFPLDYVVEGVEYSLRHLAVERLDLYQLHTWCETWNTSDDLFATLERLKTSGKVRAIGISTTESYPECVIGALESGVVDSVQVIFNLFEQHPRETILPACERHGVGVIARVPFDEGALTGKFGPETRFGSDDFRSIYFREGNLAATVERVERIRAWKEERWPHGSLADLALSWVLSHREVTSVIPGMRRPEQVDLDTRAAGLPRLTVEELRDLRRFAWRRNPWAERLPRLEDLRRLPEPDVPGVARSGW